MKTNDIIEQLRSMELDCSGRTMQLPAEIVGVIDRGQIESAWELIDVGKVLHYLSDMLEE